jgi:bifunctional DNA-binding transcriptional regulator/antitoxin component of YhaV-PrlF toxin-antitoxin module
MTQLTTIVQFQSRGVLNIPKPIREIFKIDKGTLAKISVEDDAIIIKPVEAVSPFQFKPRIFSKKEIARWLKEDTLDKKTLTKLEEKLKKSKALNQPIIKKWAKG